MNKWFLKPLAALIILVLTQVALAQSGSAELELEPTTSAAATGETLSVDIKLLNPEQQNVISVRSWLDYNPTHLKAVGIETADSQFTLSAPGEDQVAEAESRIKIGRSNIEGGVTEAETVVAKVNFEVLTASPITTEISFYDYQLTELGHTSVNIIDQGFPLNILATEPEAIQIDLNGGGAAAPTPTPGPQPDPIDLNPTPSPTPTPTPTVNQNGINPLLIRPTGLKVNSEGAFADLMWDLTPDVNRAGFNVYYGKTSGQYTRRRVLDNIDRTRIEDLVMGETYYFAVTAYDQNNLESEYSQEVGIIIGQPLSSTSPFPNVLQNVVNRIPAQPQNGPLAWWLLFSALGLTITVYAGKKTLKPESITN